MNSSPKPKTVIALKVQEKTACCSSCAEAVTPSLPSSSEALPENVLLARYRIEKLCCATEERLIRNRVDGMHGIVRLDFNLLERELTVVHRLPDTAAVVRALTEIGMPPADAQLPAATPGGTAAATLRTDTFRIEKMDCPTEEGLIRKRLGSLDGIDGLDFNLMQRKLTVQHTLPSTETIVTSFCLPAACSAAYAPAAAGSLIV